VNDSKKRTLAVAVAERIRELLATKNMTQYKFEYASGIPHGHLSQILYGRKDGRGKTVSLTTVAQIAIGFGLSMSQFLDSPIFSLEKIDID